MNELRWILLVAGALLIAAIYFWGSRARSRGAAPDDTRRPARFSGGATGFETAAPPADAGESPAPARETRRLEPSVALDDDADLERPAIERRGGAVVAEPAEVPGPSPGPARREPTLQRSEEPAPLRTTSPEAVRREPTIPPSATPPPEEDAPPGVDATPAQEAEAPASPPASRPGEPAGGRAKPRRTQKIFAVRVTAPGTSAFAGQRVLDALQAEGLRFGRYEIFHALHADGRPLFSVASLRDPGTFDPPTMASTEYPGILVFTVLPGPVRAGEAFDEMLFSARALATHLEGALADEKGAPLTALRAGKMREEALEFERSLDAA